MRTVSTEGVVLKRMNVGEADRFVTIFTRDLGKISALAKGVRKITSSRSAALEPGTHTKLLLTRSHETFIVSQAQVINAFSRAKETLAGAKQVMQVLEIVDAVMVEEEQQDVFNDVLHILKEVDKTHSTRSVVTKTLTMMLQRLGFRDMRDTPYATITEYVEFIAEKKMKSYPYLTVKTSQT